MGCALRRAGELVTRADCGEFKTVGADAGAGQQPGIPQAPEWQQPQFFALAASPSTACTCAIVVQKTARRSHARRFIQ